MEQGLTKIDSVKKIYKDRTIWAGTFLGGPLAAGYLIAENFKILNESEKVKNTWFISILCTIIIFGGVLLIPNIDKIPRQLIPLIYTAIAYYIVKYYQGAKIEEFLKTGKLKSLQELKKKLPLKVDDLLKVEGLGPKKIKVLL